MTERESKEQSEFPLADRRGARASFDFAEWAERTAFRYDERALTMLSRCESPAEAHLIRRLFASTETIDSGSSAYLRGVRIRVQVPCGPYRIDVVADTDDCQLAVEIDGAHHTATAAQIAKDYVRQRRIARAGFVVLRFTGGEAINQSTQCWREVYATLNAWSKRTKSREASA